MSCPSLSLAELPPRLRAVGWDRELHVRGVMPGAERAVAIVGSRAASAAGMRRAHGLARHLASRGIHVVSGGALGIDAAAHRGALAGGGLTTVVLGTGIDILYPMRHAALFEQIVATGGALISMFPPGTGPRPATFPQRNRLIAALADTVIVVEADVRSGSLSTARDAIELGRGLAACPGSPGCERLLAHGAGMVETELEAELAAAGTLRPRPPAVLDPVASRVRDALASGARGVDAVVSATGLSVRDVLRALPQLEGIGVMNNRSLKVRQQ